MKNKSLSKGGLYYLIYNVLNIAFPFISGIYVSRILLPDNIGNVTAAQNLAQYFVILAFLGIPTYGLREISKTRNEFVECSRVYSELFIINLCSTLIFLMIYIVLVFSVKIYREELLIYLLAGISIALNSINISWLYEGLEEFGYISLRNMIFKLISFIFLIVFVRSNEDTVWYLLMSVVGTAGNNVLNIIYAPKFVKFTREGLHFRRHFKSIFFLVTVNIAIELYSLVDITMMKFMCNSQNIAYYRYGVGIKKILLQIVNTFTMVLVPRISLFFREGKIYEFNRLLSKAFILIILTSLPMIVGLYFTADNLLVKLYGLSYSASAGVVKILSLLLIISPIGYLLGSRVMLVAGKEKLMIIPVGVGAVINIVGNFILIPLYDEYGAAVASVFSEICVMVIYILMSHKYYRLKCVRASIGKAVISCFFMGAYLFFMSRLELNDGIMIGLQIVGAVVFYGLGLFILKEEITIDYLKKIIKKIREVFTTLK